MHPDRGAGQNRSPTWRGRTNQGIPERRLVCARGLSDGDDFDEVVEGSEVIRIAGVEGKPD
jgi:hypothetical protein